MQFSNNRFNLQKLQKNFEEISWDHAGGREEETLNQMLNKMHITANFVGMYLHPLAGEKTSVIKRRQALHPLFTPTGFSHGGKLQCPLSRIRSMIFTKSFDYSGFTTS